MELDDDDIDEDEEKVTVAEQSLWYKRSRKLDRETFFPVDEQLVELMRRDRVSEVEMWSIVRELLSYCVFVTIVYIISYGNRDPMSFKMQAQMREVFVTQNGFDKIITSNDW